MLELLMAIAIVGLLMAVALKYYQTAIAKARISEGLMGSSELRLRTHEHYAVTGHWLSVSADEAKDEQRMANTGLEQMVAENGAITVQYPDSLQDLLGGSRLTLRPATRPHEQAMSLMWLCGQTAVPSGFVVQGDDQTDIPSLNLVAQCRSRGDE